MPSNIFKTIKHAKTGACDRAPDKISHFKKMITAAQVCDEISLFFFNLKLCIL